MVFCIITTALLCTALASCLTGLYYINKGRRRTAEVCRVFSEEMSSHSLDFAARNESLEAFNSRLSAENKELRRLNDIKSQFMSAVAHDLKQPITSIQGYSSLLSDEETNPIHRKMLNNIINSAENMTGLINDLVDASALSTGKLSLNMRTFNYNELMDDIYHQYKVIAAKKQIEFDIIEMPVKIDITADKLRIHQVVSNILNNAFKFTPPGGNIEIKYYTDTNFLRTSVRDSGSGISAADRSRVFERFEQFNVSPEGRRQGRGIGMAIAHEIVIAHGGTIESDSAGLGHGSLFWFSLPINRP